MNSVAHARSEGEERVVHFLGARSGIWKEPFFFNAHFACNLLIPVRDGRLGEWASFFRKVLPPSNSYIRIIQRESSLEY